MRRANESKKYATVTTSLTLKRENSRLTTTVPLCPKNQADPNMWDDTSSRTQDALL